MNQKLNAQIYALYMWIKQYMYNKNKKYNMYNKNKYVQYVQ